MAVGSGALGTSFGVGVLIGGVTGWLTTKDTKGHEGEVAVPLGCVCIGVAIKN